MTESAGASINANGDVFFDALLSDGKDVLLVATPST
jgi:hypothetical protein